MILIEENLSENQIWLLDTGRALDIELIGVPSSELGLKDCWELYGYWDGVEYLWGSTGQYAGSICRFESGRYFVVPDGKFRHISGVKTVLGTVLCVWYR